MAPRRSAPCTELASFLNDSSNWNRAARTIPGLTDERLRRARNSKKGSEKNNDVLEFIGDRVVNLACALMVEKVKFCPDHQLTVNRVITNNDTLGRLAYQLQLQKRARLDPGDSLAVDNWSPRYCLSPPKVLADLFEAFVGAVYEEHGWNFTLDWLRKLFQPLLEKATEDFLKPSKTPTLMQKLFVSHDLLNTVNYQEKLYDYLDFKSKVLLEMAEDAIAALPPNTKFIFTSNGEIGNDRDMVEIASHLVKYWICKICMSLYPENREAFLKGPHLITSITTLVTNTWTLAYLGSMLSLSSFFDVDDIDYPAKNKRVTSPRMAGQEVSKQEAPYRTKLSYALYAMIGWYHSKDSKAAEKWGIAWFKYIVIRAHDIIVEDPQYKPCLPSGADDTVTIHASAVTTVGTHSKEDFSSNEEDLEARFAAMVIQDAESRAKKGPAHCGLYLNAPHRLTIDLDEEEENENQDVNQTAPAARGSKDDCLEDLVPGMKQLNLSNSKTVNEPIKIVLNEETKRQLATLPSTQTGTQNLPREDKSSESKTTLPATKVKSELMSPPLEIEKVEDSDDVNENSLARIIQPSNEPSTAVNDEKLRSLDSHPVPFRREPPREPRAMRKLMKKMDPEPPSLRNQLIVEKKETHYSGV